MTDCSEQNKTTRQGGFTYSVVLGTKAQLFGYAAASRLADTTGSIASSKFEATQVGGI